MAYVDCPNCGNPNIRYDKKGECVCNQCKKKLQLNDLSETKTRTFELKGDRRFWKKQ